MAPWWLRSSSDEQASDDESQPRPASREVAAEAGDFALDGQGDVDQPEPAAPAAEVGEPLSNQEEAATTDEAEPGAEPRAVTADPEAVVEAADENRAERPKRRRRRRRHRRIEGVPATEEAPSLAAAPVSVPAPVVELPRPGERAAPAVQDSPPSAGEPAEAYARELVYAPPDRSQESDERNIAMFCDFENLALGVRDIEGKDGQKFEIQLLLERLLEKGKIIAKRAYADWQRYADYKRPFHEAAIELIDIPRKRYSGKNSADIKMVVDAMDLCYSKEHLDTFAIVSGDSDFSPLVSKLRENNKYVIGIGIKNSTSQLLVDNCDEFIYYEDIWRDGQKAPRLDHLSPRDAEVFGLMVDAMLALIRENKEVLWGSMIKQTMKRKRPSFNEGYYGYNSFSGLLEDAQEKGIIHLKRDRRAGTYVVSGFAH